VIDWPAVIVDDENDTRDDKSGNVGVTAGSARATNAAAAATTAIVAHLMVEMIRNRITRHSAAILISEIMPRRLRPG